MSILLAVAALSAAALAYEVLLMRWLSIVLWHHFAAMIISLALLGYGASGTFLAIAHPRLGRHMAMAFVGAAGLFGVTVLSNITLAQQVPFNPLELLWDSRQWLYLLLLYVLLSVPCACAATAIGLAFMQRSSRIHWLYQCDLIGAGSGAGSVLLALCVFSLSTCLRLLGWLGFLAAALVCRQCTRARWPPILLLSCGSLLVYLWPQPWLMPRPSAYKGLSQTLQLPEAQVLSEHSSPLGLLTVVQSPTIPLRYAPGLSLHSPVEPPAQLGLFTDADSISVITNATGSPQSLAYLDFVPAALPYHLRRHPTVLILGAGGGMDVLLARYHQASRIEAVELNPHVVHLVRHVHADVAGQLYSAANVRLHVAEARHFVTRSADAYDLIQLALIESSSASTAGLQAGSENYLLTVEAMALYLRHLHPEGLLSISRWLQLPPRDSLKLFATALTALEQNGSAQPAQHLVLIRSWQTTALFVKRRPFTTDELALVRTFCDTRGFDVAYYPGMSVTEANRYSLLDQPDFFNGAMALIGPERREFQRRYKFHITPASDDRPYFAHFFKWRALPEFLALYRQGGMALVEGGYIVLIMALIQASGAALLLMVLPLWIRRRQHPGTPYRWRLGCYFLLLGVAFLLLEISFLQRFVLFLGHPLYAMAVVLSGFLVFAGLGSGLGGAIARRSYDASMHRPIAVAVGSIVCFTLLYLVLLPGGFAWGSLLPMPGKILCTLFLLAPLAFCMGLPFPLALAQVAAYRPDMVPWAWGINGCASVVSAILATLLAMHVGFNVVMLLAAMLYALAAVIWHSTPWPAEPWRRS
jgi:hypothetical protein